MGLTISYSIRYKGKSKPAVIVEKMRQMAMDLPFQKIGDLEKLVGDECQTTKREWLKLPWSINKQESSMGECSMPITAKSADKFIIEVADGSELAEIGLATYPETVAVKYSPEADAKFREIIRSGGSTTCRFDWNKWNRHCRKQDSNYRWMPDAHEEKRMLPTKLKGLRWSSFCKTQYASDPSCGGLPNFLRCHMALIRLLEKIGTIPGVSVDINDEGHYGPACYSDDYSEAYNSGKNPTYVDHPATYDMKVLADSVGDYNKIVAGMVSALNQAAEKTGMKGVAPITDFPNFDELAKAGESDQYAVLGKMAAIIAS